MQYQLYGSSLWNLFNGQCDWLYIAWNNAVRSALDLPRATHRYLIEGLSGHLHPQAMLPSRLLKFHHSISKCHKPCMKFLQELCRLNHQTAYCNNLSQISWSIGCSVEDLSYTQIKRELKYCPAPENQKWKVNLLKELLELKWNILEIDGLLEEDDPLVGWIDSIAVGWGCS